MAGQPRKSPYAFLRPLASAGRGGTVAREERAAFGDALPAGLRLTSTEGRATDDA